ncbi:MOP flippase family protein [Paraburkholderia haematera]|uniref:Lipopolysaccharide biosynthesis protein WzxC n=1 Tax=Paraburkholderia haematera TaxID=2793077 RepID=A0ABM8QHM1_9BURK|nr:MOP flippase family protein [Paraburkholderia haematera]CAE6696699.1 Lipopolysaccharide biosynthesis protein WzxC [Paraburkholderia haematera]
MSLREKAISGAKWSAASMISIVSVQFLQVAILAHLLRPGELGLASMVSLVTTLADMFLDMGLSTAIVQRKNVAANELSSLYWLNVLFGAVLGGLLLAGSGLAAWFFSEPELKALVGLAALMFFVSPHGLLYQSLMARELMFDMLSKIEVASSMVLFITTLVAALRGYGAYSPVIGALTAAVCRVVLLNLNGRKLHKPGLRLRFSETRSYLSFGVFQAMDSMVNYLNVNFGGIVAGRALGAATLGGYNLALNCAVNFPARLNPFFTRVLFPVFSIIQDDIAKLRQNYYKLTGFIAMFNFPLVFGLMVVAPDFVVCMFGEKWLWATPVLRVLCLVGAFRCIGNPVASLMMATANIRVSFWFNLTKTTAMLPAIIVGAYLGGALGVAISLLTVEAMMLLPMYRFMLKRVLGPSFGEFCNACFVPLRMTIPMVASVLVVSELLDASSMGHVLKLVTEVTLGAVVFGVTFLLDRSLLCAEIRGIVFKMVRKAALRHGLQ